MKESFGIVIIRIIVTLPVTCILMFFSLIMYFLGTRSALDKAISFFESWIFNFDLESNDPYIENRQSFEGSKGRLKNL